MTTHCAVFCPGDEKQGPRLYWASDRKYTFNGGTRFHTTFETAPKHFASEYLFLAGAGSYQLCRKAAREAAGCAMAEDLAEALRKLEGWPKEDGPEFLIGDKSGLWLLTDEPNLLRVKPWSPVAIGSGDRYADGAARVLMPQVPTARTDWASIVRRAVLVAGECDEGTEGVESGVWTPGPAVLELPDYEAVAV